MQQGTFSPRVRGRVRRAVFPLLLQGLFSAIAMAEEGDPELAWRLEPERAVYRVGQVAIGSIILRTNDLEVESVSDFSFGVPDDQRALVSFGAPQQVDDAADGTVEWRMPVRFEKAGELSLAPSLSYRGRKILFRQGGFVRYAGRNGVAMAPAGTRTVADLPEEGRPADFAGAVGSFSFWADLSPTNACPEDVLTLTWVLEGPGADRVDPVPSFSPGPGFRTYPPRVEERGERMLRVTQWILPLSTNATAAAAFSIPVFDPAVDAYRRLSAGPWSLCVTPRSAPSATPDADVAAALASAERLGRTQMRTAETGAWAFVAPSTRSKRLFTVPGGVDVTVTETVGNWTRIRLPDGRAGWIAPSVE